MDGKRLITLARQTIEAAFTKKPVDLTKYKKYNQKRGVFVTLTKDGELRGCIGFVLPQFPLYDAVQRAARSAAFEDPRFPALEAEELGEIRVEVSVLTKPKILKVAKPEEYIKAIKIGRDGLIIKHGFYSGLLLPQVPVEYGWNTETFLEHLCLKAGLPPTAWKEKGTTIESFQAEIFSEE